MAGPSPVQVVVGPLPAWLDAARLLGEAPWEVTETDAGRRFAAALNPAAAADLAARLRGLGFGGHAVEVAIAPALPRALVRDARTEDARRRRDTTPGFTRPDVRLDEEGRWSLTPEVLAFELGQRFAGQTVVDLGCGCGGNTVGFARAGARVIAIEPDPVRAAATRHNARRYGVADRVRVIEDDHRALPEFPADVLFIDPPWGTAWDRVRTPLGGLPLIATALAARHPTVVAKLPPSIDTREAPGARAEGWFGAAPGDRQRVKFVTLTWSISRP